MLIKKKKQQLIRGVYAIGNFDGVHCGHAKLIAKAKELALAKRKELGVIVKWGIITLDPHPYEVFDKRKHFLLTPTNIKEDIIKKHHGGEVVVINFTKKIAKINYEKFFYKYLVDKLGILGLVTGENFHFGYKKEGNVEKLKQLTTAINMVYEVVEKVMVDNKVCSSSNIRECLEIGNIKAANKFLGRNFAISGEVLKGKQLGRLLGFPTANIDISNYAKLKYGVYLVKTIIDGIVYNAIANFGVRPSVDDDKKEILEVHILNFNDDIYGKTIDVEFIDMIRTEKKFNSLEELKIGIAEDVKIAQSYFDNNVLV